MILHLTPGSGSVELHFHDDAQVALYQPGERPAPGPTSVSTMTGRQQRWLLVGLTGAVCLALGYSVAPRGSAATARVPVSLVRPMAPLPSNIPLVPEATPLPRYEAPILALPPARPHTEAEPADGVPAALARQLTQAPVVVPPSIPARPPAASSAFGLEN